MLYYKHSLAGTHIACYLQHFMDDYRNAAVSLVFQFTVEFLYKIPTVALRQTAEPQGLKVLSPGFDTAQ